MSNDTTAGEHGERLWPMAAVTRRTGIGEHTLRAWERRFGFPVPHRLPSGHRRYTSEQVRHLSLIGTLLQYGHRAGDVVGLPVEELEQLLRESGGGPPVGVVDEDWAEEILARALAFDRSGVADALNRQAAILGLPAFVRERAAPLLDLIGTAWSDGRLAIRHEHFLSEVLQDVLRSLRAGLEGAAAGKPVLLATFPGESHGMGLQLVALLVLLAGRPARTLGVEAPVEEIAEAARTADAVAVGLSVSAASDRAEADASVRELRARLPAEIALWLGGSGASNLANLPGGVQVMAGLDDLEAALEILPPG